MKLKQKIATLALLMTISNPVSFTEASQTACEGKTLVVLGDSLTSGYGLGPGEAFPEKLGEALRKEGYRINLINAGVSGDTTTGGLARLAWSLPETTDAVIVELGANDALRGIPPDITRGNLEAIIASLKERGVEVLLAGMLAPPNMGKPYGDSFNAIYPALAEESGVMLYPFFLEGVAGQPELNQADGIHPTTEGIKRIVGNVLPYAVKLMRKACGL